MPDAARWDPDDYQQHAGILDLALVVDGEALSFDSEFDAVFSNAALHWMTKPDLVQAPTRQSC
jgi:hypothetical protein